jgi:hypothetical protein
MNRNHDLQNSKGAAWWLPGLQVYEIPPVLMYVWLVYVGTVLPDILGIDRSTLAGFDALFVRSLDVLRPIVGIVGGLGTAALGVVPLRDEKDDHPGCRY